MIGAVVVGLLALAALAYATGPLWKGPSLIPDEDDRLALAEVEAKKRAALLAIIDLEEEHELGKLTEDDLAVLRARYEADALVALREIDGLAEELSSRSDELEEEIARMRESMSCPECGALRTGSECTRCGAR